MSASPVSVPRECSAQAATGVGKACCFGKRCQFDLSRHMPTAGVLNQSPEKVPQIWGRPQAITKKVPKQSSTQVRQKNLRQGGATGIAASTLSVNWIASWVEGHVGVKLRLPARLARVGDGSACVVSRQIVGLLLPERSAGFALPLGRRERSATFW